jgi:hypothetical protein
MPSERTAQTPPLIPRPRPTFTVADADQALVLVRKITADIVARYHQLVELRAERERLRDMGSRDEDLVDLQRTADRCVERLEHLHRELLDVGCVLRDWRAGLVNFPSFQGDRTVWLSWRLGEARVGYWHDLHASPNARRKITDDFRAAQDAAAPTATAARAPESG